MSEESAQNVVSSLANAIADLDADPHCSWWWDVESHKKGGLLDVVKTKIGLYLSPNQQGSGCVEGNKLRVELGDKLVLNANLLDFYLANPYLIPEDWRGKYTFFWGTIYRTASGSLYVRYLYCDGRHWRWSYRILNHDWYFPNPAAVIEP